MPIDGGQRIAGEISREGSTTFEALDPTNGLPLEGSFAEATPAEIDRAARRAGGAARAFRAAPALARAELLEEIADEIEKLGETLVERATRETALPAGRIEMERGRTCGQLRAFASALRSGDLLAPVHDPGDPARASLPKPDLVRRRIAVGPVAVFGASNFPLAFSVAGGDTAAALAAGCPVVVKSHPLHPGTSELVAGAIGAAIAATSLPPGLFSLLQGREPATGEALVRHPAIRAVGFTGSFAAGRALTAHAASRPDPIPVFAEMGSSNPVFILPGALDARSKELAEGIAGSVCLGVGQFCTNPGLVVVLDRGGDSDELVETLTEKFRSTEAGTALAAGIQSGYRAGLERLGEVSGVEELARGPLSGTTCAVNAALFRVDALAFLAEPSLTDEVFGPSTLLVIARSEEEFFEVATSFRGQLTATVHGEEKDGALRERLVPILEERVGRLVWNGFPTGVEVSPAMQHGGPWPATSDSRSTSVGLAAIDRFLRPVCYQDWPE